MRTVLFETRDLCVRNHARSGVFQFYDLLSGEPATPGNFLLQLSVLSGDFVSPRHRHNFDQVRYQLEGAFDYGADGEMVPGSIAYFPEGTRYGPQRSLSSKSITLVLQFGGASGNGYMSEAEFQEGLAALKEEGTFRDGVFARAKPEGGSTNQDAYEAVWEHVYERALVYPKERYTRPVFMNPACFDWVANGNGTATKLIGVFSELGTKIAFHHVDEGAGLSLEPNSIYFACSGAGEVTGSPWRRWTTVALGQGERGVARAAGRSELLQVRLPTFQQAAARREASR